MLQSRLKARICALRAKAGASTTTARQRYKKVYDLQTRVTTMFQPGDRAIFHRPSLAVTSDKDAARTALNSYNKLMPRNLGPFWVKALCPHSHVINKYDIDNVVLTDRAARAPPTEQPILTDNSGIRQRGTKDPKTSPQSARCKLDTAKAGEAKRRRRQNQAPGP